eukprot:765212-Hanusia_phi.AAC.2
MYVFKHFKKASHASRYFDEALGQILSIDLCRKFRARAKDARVSFLPIFIAQFEDGRNAFVEKFLDGEFQKYNNNDGFVRATHPLPQAFSHFTWTWSKGKFLVCDIQGTECDWTDPQIHTIDGDGFGCGNRGMQGICDFFQTHQCNEWCANLGLSPSDRPMVLEALDQTRKSRSVKKRLANAAENASSPRSPHKPLMLYLLRSVNSEKQTFEKVGAERSSDSVPRDSKVEPNKDNLFPIAKVHSLDISKHAEQMRTNSSARLKFSKVVSVAVKLIRTLSPRGSDHGRSSPRVLETAEKTVQQNNRPSSGQQKPQ